MNIKLKQTWGLLILILVTLTYLAINFFGTQNKDPKIKEIYFADRMTTAHKILIDEYNKLNKGKVKVIPIDFPNEDFSTNEKKEVLARSLRGRGDGIDVFAVDIIWVQRFAKWCEPLDKYFTKKEKDGFINEALESCYCDGEMVAAPLDLVLGVMYYRKDLVKKMKNSNEILKKINNSISWSDFIKLKYKCGLNYPFYIFPGADYEGLICNYYNILLSLKPDYFKTNGFNFETIQAEKSLELLVNLVNKDQLSPAQVSQFTEISSYKYFIKHNGIFLWGWTSFDKDFNNYPVFKNRQNDLRKAPMPHFKGEKPASIVGGWDIMISKFSDKKKEAVDFIKFLLKKKSQDTFFEKSAYDPVIKSFYQDSVYLKKFPELIFHKQLLQGSVHRPSHIEYTKYSKILSYYINKAIKKEIPVIEALKKSGKAIQLDKLILN